MDDFINSQPLQIKKWLPSKGRIKSTAGNAIKDKADGAIVKLLFGSQKKQRWYLLVLLRCALRGPSNNRSSEKLTCIVPHPFHQRLDVKRKKKKAFPKEIYKNGLYLRA